LTSRIIDVPKPVLQALVLADHVYQDKITGKKIIAGTFNRVCFTRMRPRPPAAELEPGEASVSIAGAGFSPAPPPPLPQPPAAPQTQMPATPFAEGAAPPGVPPGLRRLTAADVQKAGSPYAFVSLTDVHGTVPLELRYRDLSNEAILLGINFQVGAEDPLDTVEAVIPVPPLPTPHAGVYALELLCGGEPLGALRITAVETPPQ
jgi:hypothetical protein